MASGTELRKKVCSFRKEWNGRYLSYKIDVQRIALSLQNMYANLDWH